MPERHPAWVTGINDFEARLATGALVTAYQVGDQLDPLRVRSGIRDAPGEPGRLTLGTNKVTVNPFQAVIQDPARPALGAYVVTLDAPAELPLTASDPSLNRTDLVIAEIVDEDPGFAVRVVEGERTSNTTPQPPAVTNPLHLRIGQIFVPSGGGTPGFTDTRQFTAATGGILPVRGAADMPPAAHGSQFVYRLDTQELMVRVAGRWVAYRPRRGSVDTWHAPTLLNTWVNYGGSHVPAGYTVTEDGWVHLRGLVKNATAANVTKTIFTLPAGYRPPYQYIFAVKVDGGGVGRLDVRSDGTVINGSSADGPLSGSWTSLDNISFATY